MTLKQAIDLVMFKLSDHPAAVRSRKQNPDLCILQCRNGQYITTSKRRVLQTGEKAWSFVGFLRDNHPHKI